MSVSLAPLLPLHIEADESTRPKDHKRDEGIGDDNPGLHGRLAAPAALHMFQPWDNIALLRWL